ncbi:MAG: AI-2E family transporter [Planctomycetes bacterium]|nr:AI-2E family transporter [Planctomycetota bacterium]
MHGPAQPATTKREHRPRSSIAAIVLAVLATIYTLAIAKPVLLPFVLAFLVKLVLDPPVRWLRRRGIPTALGATALLLVMLGAGAYGVYRISEPASRWMERLPGDLREVRMRVMSSFSGISGQLDSVEEVTKAVEEITKGDDAKKPLEVAVVNQRPGTTLLGGLWDAGANLALVLVLALFMLTSSESLLRALVASTKCLGEGKAVVAMVHAIDRSITRYMLTIVVINVALGVCVAGICAAFGLPNPALWGVVATLANFVPYVGALAGVAVVAVLGITELDSLTFGILPAVCYGLLNLLEGMVVTPIVLGRSLTISPIVLFSWLLLLGWLWGIPGALIAVPLLVAFKIACDHIPRLQGLAKLLSASSRSDRQAPAVRA